MFVSRIIWKEILYYSSTFFSDLFKDKVLRYNTVRISNISQVKASSSVRNNASVNSSCAQTPPPPPTTPGYCGAFARLVSPGEGHLQILRCSGPGICQPRGQSRTFDRHAVSHQNIPTQRILMEKQADWLICQGEGKIVKACSRFDACISSLLIKLELHCKIGSYRRDL